MPLTLPPTEIIVFAGSLSVLGEQHRVYLAACAAGVYELGASTNNNGQLIEGRRHLGLSIKPTTAGEGEEESTRQVYVVASSQFLYPGVRLLGRFEGYATVGEGEEAETRAVYAVAPCTHCLVTADYFQRAEPGDVWDQIAGEATLTAGKLVTNDADAVFIHWQPIPDGSFESPEAHGRVTVTITASNAGSKARVFLAYSYDTELAHCAELEVRESDALLRLGILDEGELRSNFNGPVVLAGRGAGVPTTIRLCYSEVPIYGPNLAAEVLLDDGWWRLDFTDGGGGGIEPAPDGFYHGVGTGDNFGDVSFADYYVEKTVGTNHQQGCYDCVACNACPPGQQLCLRVDNEDVILNRNSFCWWSSVAHEGVTWVLFLLVDGDGNWTAELQKFVGFIPPVLYGVADLGTTPPRCDEWDCLELVDPSDEEDVVAAVTSGAVCCEFYDEDAGGCHQDDLPATLTINVFDGNQFYELTLEAFVIPPSVGYEFNYSDGDWLIEMQSIDGFEHHISINGPAGSEFLTVDLSSCNPYSASFSGAQFSGDITE